MIFRSMSVSRLLLTLGLSLPLMFGAVSNQITIVEKDGVTTNNYPIQIGRPFVPLEIPDYPQAVINGQAVPTQADVKERWPDGSVKHAILAFLIPTLRAGSTVVVQFANQPSGNNSALPQSAMQSASYDFDAQILISNGATPIASARRMLNDGAYTLWTSGQIAQAIVLADHRNTASCGGHKCSSYDMGFDSYKSVRPIFHATFWPGINKVHVRFIGEISNTETLQDLTYSLALKLGNSTPRQVYSKAAFTHYAETRWTKDFWIGGAPSAIQIDHNLPYLISTQHVWNYALQNASLLTNTVIAQLYSGYQTAAKDIGDTDGTGANPGNYVAQYQPGTGNRPDIGPYPAYVVRWLLTFDYRLEQIVRTNADLSAAFPVHLREGTSKNLTRGNGSGGPGMGCTYQCDAPGVGKILAPTGRPSVRTNLFSSSTLSADGIVPVKDLGANPWTPDVAHGHEPWSAIYLLTGDFWYLEELWFRAAWDALYPMGISGGTSCVYGDLCRGPHGTELGYFFPKAGSSQLRSVAWALRTRVHAASVSPDNTPEKSYFETGVNDLLAICEGAHNITGSSLYNDPYYKTLWTWAKTYEFTIDSANPLPFHQYNVGLNIQDSWVDSSVTHWAIQTFEQNYFMLALGRAQELGYPAAALISWQSALYTSTLTDPSFNPFLITDKWVPTIRQSDGKPFDTLANLKTGFLPAFQNTTTLGAYATYLVPAVSFVYGQTNGPAAWAWVNRNIVNNAALWSSSIATDGNIKWAILPRLAQFSACDLNQDGLVDVGDVQLAINAALGVISCGSNDVDGNGVCNVVDVSKIISGALGNPCP
jgi:hypothetical protein